MSASNKQTRRTPTMHPASHPRPPPSLSSLPLLLSHYLSLLHSLLPCSVPLSSLPHSLTDSLSLSRSPLLSFQYQTHTHRHTPIQTPQAASVAQQRTHNSHNNAPLSHLHSLVVNVAPTGEGKQPSSTRQTERGRWKERIVNTLEQQSSGAPTT